MRSLALLRDIWGNLVSPMIILLSSQNVTMFRHRGELLTSLGEFWANILSNATKWALFLYEFGLILRLSRVCQVKGLGGVGNTYDSMVECGDGGVEALELGRTLTKEEETIGEECVGGFRYFCAFAQRALLENEVQEKTGHGTQSSVRIISYGPSSKWS